MVLTKIGASLGGSADIINVVQTSHTFVSNDRGKAVRMNNNSGTPQYVLAIASATSTADAIGIIIHVTDANNFTMATSGRITVDYCVPNEVAGTVLFLSHATAGVLTSTEPSAEGHVSKPMAVITIADSEMIMFQQRGEVIGTGGAASAPTDANYLVGTANSNLSAEIVVGTAPGGELGNTWASPTVDGTHSGSAHHAQAHTVASHSDTTGTGAELETLTDGSNAESLHTHTHTVVSHSDTTATGAELETLTDGSTTALHVHAGGGKIGQVVQAVKTSVFNMGSSTFADIGLAVNITPTATNSKILIHYALNGSQDEASNRAQFKMLRSIGGGTATDVFVGVPDGSRTGLTGAFSTSHDSILDSTAGGVYLDSPSTTSQINYKFMIRRLGGGDVYINRTQVHADNSDTGSWASSIVCMEVLA